MARFQGGQEGGRAAGAPRRWRVAVGVMLLAALAVLVGGLGSAWRSRGADAVDPVLQQIRERGVLRVGYAVEAPYAFIDAGGEVTGESPETARLVAHALGVPRIEWVQVPFNALIDELLAERFDVVAAGLFVTPARQTRVLFSDPTLRVGAGLLVRRAEGREIVSRQGLRVAVVQGAVEAERLPLWLPAAVPIGVPDVQTARAALLVGEADAVALSWPTLAWLAQDSGGEWVAFRLDPTAGAAPDLVAFAFRREHGALRGAWNAAQRTVVGGAAHLAVLQRFHLGAADLASPAVAATGSRP